MSNPDTDAPSAKSENLSPFQQLAQQQAQDAEPTEATATEQVATEVKQAEPSTEPQVKSIQDLVRKNTEAANETHEVFTDLVKPGKDSKRGDQIQYVKDVGNRWEARAKELEGELEAAQGKTFDPTETEEWAKAQEELTRYKSEAEEKRELEEKLAALDLQYDPQFGKEITQPLAEAENSVLEIVKLSKGEDAGELVPLLQAAVVAESEQEFLLATKQIADQVDQHFGMAVFEGLKDIRNLNKKKAAYLANHQEASQKFVAERQKNNKATSQQFMNSEWKEYRSTATNSVQKSWDLLDQLGDEKMAKTAKDTREQAAGWVDAGIKETIDEYGGISPSMAQTIALAPELLSLIPVVDQAMEYIKNINADHDKLKEEYAKLTNQGSRATSGRTDRTRASAGEDQPLSLVDFAKSQGAF